jgi:hypothetical protein
MGWVYVSGLVSRVLGFRVLGFRVSGVVGRAPGSEFRLSGWEVFDSFRFQVSVFGFRGVSFDVSGVGGG